LKRRKNHPVWVAPVARIAPSARAEVIMADPAISGKNGGLSMSREFPDFDER
jgi:hypothetical protein